LKRTSDLTQVSFVQAFVTELEPGGVEIMLQQKQAYISFRGNYGFMLTLHQGIGVSSRLGIYQNNREKAFKLSDPTSEELTEPDDADAPLDDAAQSEREYVRERLREELKREPTEDELDEWLRQHTEGY
jgi:hypothetical protein